MVKCPFCDGKEIGNSNLWGKQFNCLSVKHHNGKITRTDECKDRQIASLKERLEAWRVMWEECMRMADKYNMEMYPEVKKLKDLGEI